MAIVISSNQRDKEGANYGIVFSITQQPYKDDQCKLW